MLRSYSYVDVSLGCAVRQTHPKQRHLHTYDAGCMFDRKGSFKRRITSGGLIPNELFPSDLHIGVPDWHILTHIPTCMDDHYLGWIPGAAKTSGESVEAFWSLMNPLQYMTCEMSDAVRKDTLNDSINALVWKKIAKEGEPSCALMM